MESDEEHPNSVSFYSVLLKFAFGLGGAAAAFAWSAPLLVAGFGMAAGAGHGTTFYFMAMAPLGLRVWTWPAVGFLLALRRSRVAAWTAAGILAYTYIFTAWYWLYSPMEDTDLSSIWRKVTRPAVAFAIWYLLGQIAFWTLILTAGRKRAKMETSTT